MTTQTELAELAKSLRLHWIDQTQDEEADAEEKCCYLIGTAAADALEAQSKRIAELEQAPQAKPLTKTKIGNYLRKQFSGDSGQYCNGFKDGVRYAEQAHGVKP